ncbi:MAG: HAD family phosphatase, partial [Candidatus Liptonbacteria bacterium]|nr:HAD family phosphatase [Candidatus Liptonbacteria bacterium]
RERGLENKWDIFQKLSEDVDRAHITHEQFVADFAREIGVPERTVWPEIRARFLLNHGLMDIVVELKKRYKVGLLSNFTHPWLSELLREYDLRKHFDEVLISSQEKMIKPDPRFFQKMLGLLGAEAAESVFIDDKQTNVDGAKNLGIHALLFTTNKQFRNDLRGIINSDK